MISLISSALIIVLSPCQPLAHPAELPVETTVQDEAANLGDESAQERMVHLFIENDALAEHLLEPTRELPLVIRPERHRSTHVRTRLAQILVEQRTVR